MKVGCMSAGLIVLVSLGGGCEPEPEPDDAGEPTGCDSTSSPTVEIGRGVGGAFVPYEDGEAVGLTIAPQGGYGVAVQTRTTGLHAADDALATVHVYATIDDERVGDFTLFQQSLLCTGENGSLTGIVVGLDPARFGSNDALLALDGALMTLHVDVLDEENHTGRGEQRVTLEVGE